MAASLENEDDVLVNDLYALLNVGKDATIEEVNHAFRSLSKIYHPDKHQDAARKRRAEEFFNKLKKAHEILSDQHKRTIYDTYGEKGLETEGLEIISRTKTPAEIIAEYERLQREKEERRLQQRTNPRGTISVGINATDIFEGYPQDDGDIYSPTLNVEINSMSMYQSVECPLTVKDTVIIGGNIQTHNGTGSGAFLATWRRLTSDKGWMEVEAAAGNGVGVSLKGFRQITRRCYGTSAIALHTTPKGFKPALSTMLAYQFDRDIQGRITYNAGFPSSISTAIVYSNQKHHAALLFQVGLANTYLSFNYIRKFQEDDAKLRGAIKFGLTGGVVEYGFEKKITQFSNLGATMVIGIPSGVHLKIRLHRGSQTFLFPIHLSETISPSAILYGTFVPIAAFFLIKKLIVEPFLKQQKEQELEKKREEHADKLAKRKQEAKAATDLMKATVERSIEAEERKMGLVIIKALYGKLQGSDDGELIDRECIDVTIQLQALVKDSKLIVPEAVSKSGLPGFYDPCIGEEKSLYIRYKFRNRLHQATVGDMEPIRLPQQSMAFNEG
ncbi:dnaJ homolog subfamily C member 11-like isoform X2 [Pomacea canaliculata]|uniref:dnaJ homolog subfamily C member 11-like isoform X2 n=1 Tax=Pomacea canaliculata TaxID=400727 RepID=UPI000D739215|nr:dnaJ homolog subfamily C member 11-like isoform X2 [Pomacea canaliculata]